MTAHRTYGHWVLVAAFAGGAAACGGSQSTVNAAGSQGLTYLAPQNGSSTDGGSAGGSADGGSAGGSGGGASLVTYGQGLPPCPTTNNGACDATSAGGRMTGGGIVTENDLRVSHGFELHCDASDPRQNLEVNWDGHQFSLASLDNTKCIADSSIDEGHPVAGFDVFTGVGTGRYDGQDGATIRFVFSDAGEPGSNDTAAIVIHDAAGNEVLSVQGKLTGGNQQAHQDNGNGP